MEHFRSKTINLTLHEDDKNVKLFQILLTIPFLLLIFYVSKSIIISQVIDPDLFWHIQCGKDIVNNLFLLWNDYYYTAVTESYTNSRFTGLGDVILYFIYDNAGIDGLIYFRAFCVFSCVFFLFLLSDRVPNALKLFIFTLMIIGIYQKMLIRNSMFALVFFPATLYFFEKSKWIFLSLTIIIWSFCHGSYLLGFGIIPILMISNGVINKKLLLALVIIFAIISYNNPTTKNYYSINKVKGIFERVIETKSLNQTIFQPGKIKSVEFSDPLKVDRLFIKYAIGIFILTLCLVRPRVRYILPFLAVSFIGLGYIRFVGYMAIVSAYVILKAEKEDGLRKADQLIYLIAFLILSAFCLTQPGSILYDVSKPGLGASDFKFSERNADYALEKYKDSDTFTTISMGGWLLLKWLPEKRVNLDTFWEPHPGYVRTEYIACYSNPNLIKQKTALIGFNDIILIQRMCRTKKWFPERIDQSSVLFTRERISLFVDVLPEEIQGMTEIHKKIYATILLSCGVPVSEIENHINSSMELNESDHKK